jgi:hypothetical protein
MPYVEQPSRLRDSGNSKIQKPTTNNLIEEKTMSTKHVRARDLKEVSGTFSTSDQEAVMNAIADIRQKLPFLVDLTTEERRSIAKLSSKGLVFVRKALAIAEQNPQILPPLFNLAEMRDNADLFESLTGILLAVDQLRKQLDDTAVSTGSKVYAAARAVYAYAGSAGAALETATTDLGHHFARKGNGAAAKPPVPDPPPAVQPNQT